MVKVKKMANEKSFFEQYSNYVYMALIVALAIYVMNDRDSGPTVIYINQTTQTQNVVPDSPSAQFSSCDPLCKANSYTSGYAKVGDCKAGEYILTYGYPGQPPLLTCCCSGALSPDEEDDADEAGNPDECGFHGLFIESQCNGECPAGTTCEYYLIRNQLPACGCKAPTEPVADEEEEEAGAELTYCEDFCTRMGAWSGGMVATSDMGGASCKEYAVNDCMSKDKCYAGTASTTECCCYNCDPPETFTAAGCYDKTWMNSGTSYSLSASNAGGCVDAAESACGVGKVEWTIWFPYNCCVYKCVMD